MDKYFEKKEQTDTTDIQSLTGNSMQSTEFNHNNMVPFFGSKITQGGVGKGHEGLLDLYTGAGSQQNRKENE